MKHLKINKQNINLEKKLCHLKRKQLDYIFDNLKMIYEEESVNDFSKKELKYRVINRLDSIIKERGIWLPYKEVTKFYEKKINRLNK